MNDRITLMGAEDVERAARNMVGAADTMIRAAAQIEDTFQRQRVAMEEWLARFEAVIERANGGGQ